MSPPHVVALAETPTETGLGGDQGSSAVASSVEEESVEVPVCLRGEEGLATITIKESTAIEGKLSNAAVDRICEALEAFPLRFPCKPAHAH